MTRAEEALFIGGALALREKEPAENSWYANLRRLFDADDRVADALWTDRFDWGEPPRSLGTPRSGERTRAVEPLPSWVNGAPSAEPRPARPLAPSALGDDPSPDPPSRAAQATQAARRGVLVHRLLERLPEVARAERAALGAGWLARNAPAMPEAERLLLRDGALAVLDDPRWSELFAPGALAEVPIAAPVGARVVAGTIDRLLVAPDRIRLVDFKTARHPPASAEDVPAAILRQMAAYVLALESAYPGRAVEAALLYTAAPRLIALPAALLDQHKRALLAAD